MKSIAVWIIRLIIIIIIGNIISLFTFDKDKIHTFCS